MAQPLWLSLRDAGLRSADALLELFNINTPPVDVADIARRLGVQLATDIWVPSGRLDATDPANATIYVSPVDGAARQRFTIAHELGHLFLHDLGIMYRDYSGTPEEIQANRFAADLLVPWWMLDVAKKAVGRNPSELARLFQVSEQMMRIRMRLE